MQASSENRCEGNIRRHYGAVAHLMVPTDFDRAYPWTFANGGDIHNIVTRCKQHGLFQHASSSR